MKIPSSRVKIVVTAVTEASSYFSVYSSVQKVLRCICHFYPYKIKLVCLLQYGDSEVRKTFALQFLARKVVDVMKYSGG